ncbi:hypothetical protein AVEN_225870-1 [Araneus ventricosus]|uniref:Uncharacterized protein n=1 Tax=Araneus ventricosus TaxID=182803 RepID=A0A4Y2BBC0_ARAVE|nr:hypothetical protein AVEN_225870-1 [Araneus ventricosus]
MSYSSIASSGHCILQLFITSKTFTTQKLFSLRKRWKSLGARDKKTVLKTEEIGTINRERGVFCLRRRMSRADRDAKSAVVPISISIPVGDLRKHVEMFLHTKWQEQWDLETDNKLHTLKPLVQP